MGPREVADRALTVGATAARRVTGDREPDDATLLGRADPDWAALLGDFRAGTGRPVLLDRDTAAAVAAAHPEAVKELLAAADRVLEHRFTFFAHPEAHYPGPIDWSYDPLSGVHWPDLPSHAINHRAGHGDPKWIWELNRLQHLPWLAQAWLLTGDERYGTEALDQLDAWITANPPGRGIAWRGAFEVGVRAISVLVALQGLADHPALTPERYARAVRMLAAGARRCWRDRSKHSSANNHLVGELAGLATVAILLPELAAVGALGARRRRRPRRRGRPPDPSRRRGRRAGRRLPGLHRRAARRRGAAAPPASRARPGAGGRDAARGARAVGGAPRRPRRHRRPHPAHGGRRRGLRAAPRPGPDPRGPPAPRARRRPHRPPGRPAARARPTSPRRGSRPAWARTPVPTSPGSPGPRTPPTAGWRSCARGGAGSPSTSARSATWRSRPTGTPTRWPSGSPSTATTSSATRAPAATSPTRSGAPRTAAPARTPRSPSTTPTSR